MQLDTPTALYLSQNDHQAFGILVKLIDSTHVSTKGFLDDCVSVGQLSMVQAVQKVGGINSVCRENLRWTPFVTSMRVTTYFELIRPAGIELLAGFTDTRVIYYLAQWVKSKMDRLFGGGYSGYPTYIKNQHRLALEGIEIFRTLDRDAAKILKDQANQESPNAWANVDTGITATFPNTLTTTSPTVQPSIGSPSAITAPEVIMAYEIGFDRYQSLTHQSRTQAMESVSAIFRESDSLTLQALTEWARSGVQTGLAGLVKIGLDLLEQERTMA